MTTLAEKYVNVCNDLKVKANSAVKKQLPESAEGFTSWDLNGNIVGTKGVVAVLRIVEGQLPKLTHLSLAGNNLGSEATKPILAALVGHPSIESLDLSNNDIRLGGPELVELLKKNKNIKKLNVENTHLRPLFVRLIAIQLTKNNGGAEAAAAAPTPKGGKKEKKAPRFSFGDAAPPADDGADEDEAAAGEGEDDDGEAAGGGFAAFGEPEEGKHVAWEGSQGDGGKKVPRRPTVCAEVFREEEIDKFVPEVIEKDPKVKQWLMNVLERHDLFSHLEDFELSVAVDAMQEASRMKGDTIFDEEDEEDGDLFYVIGNGEVELTVKGEHSATLTKGSTTQDLMLMYAQPYAGTAVCKEDSTIFSLDRITYKCVLNKASKKKRAMYEDFLKGVGFLKNLSHIELLQLADALKPATYEAGQTLIRYGEQGETFFIIVEGVVDVYGRNDEGKEIKVCDFTIGENVGELEFLNNHKCVADVKAQGFVRVAKMNKHHFEMVMGPALDLLKKTADESEVYTYYRDQLDKMEKNKEGGDEEKKEEKKEAASS